LRNPPLVVICGPSGSGKTRLLVRLIPALRRLGVRVAAVKHSGHRHALDRPGKDSDRLRKAGAVAVVLETPNGFALVGPPVRDLRLLARLFPPVDLVLCEGGKSLPLPKVEVHRRVLGEPFLCKKDRRYVAVVTDEPAPRALPSFSPGDARGLARFLTARFVLR
jgi:molybdopterin-guanine dinucleotide biosynthesis protein B